MWNWDLIYNFVICENILNFCFSMSCVSYCQFQTGGDVKKTIPRCIGTTTFEDGGRLHTMENYQQTYFSWRQSSPFLLPCLKSFNGVMEKWKGDICSLQSVVLQLQCHNSEPDGVKHSQEKLADVITKFHQLEIYQF